VQRFESIADLDVHHTTIEEREEYEQHIVNGVVVYAGVVSNVVLQSCYIVLHCHVTSIVCLQLLLLAPHHDRGAGGVRAAHCQRRGGVRRRGEQRCVTFLLHRHVTFLVCLQMGRPNVDEA
jgi:hypothetical protein